MLRLLDSNEEIATVRFTEGHAADVVLKVGQAQRVHRLQAHRVPDPDMGSLEGTAGLPCGDQQLVGVDGHALDVGGVAEVVPLGLLLHVVKHDNGGHKVNHLTRRQKVKIGSSISTPDDEQKSINPIEMA